MDFVGISVVGTFFAMIGVSVFGMQTQKPPATRARTICPASNEPAEVSLIWNTAEHALGVEDCDGREFPHDCQHVCLAQLSKSEPVSDPSHVIV